MPKYAIMSFSNKNVLITGAASGIGKTTALLFAEKGATIIVVDINEDGGQETVAEIEEIGGTAYFYQVDQSDQHAVQQLFVAVKEKVGQVHIAVNNAGILGQYVPTHIYPANDWHRVIGVNLNGVFYCMQMELAMMLEQGGGAIINVASVAGLKAMPYASAYAASKHALIGLTKSAALEYAKKNIRINAVCPVFTQTPMLDDNVQGQEQQKEKFRKLIPSRQFAKPKDIANAILWLADGQTAYVTGISLPVDGGLMAS